MTAPDYLKALKSAIASTSKFQFVSGSGNVRDILLMEDGSVRDDRAEIESWRISEDAARHVYVLTLLLPDKIPYSLFTMRRNGEWKGRDRKTRGTVLLRPYPLEGNAEKWGRLADPSAYFRSIKPDVTKPEFHYLEPLPRQKDWTKEENWKITQEIELSRLPAQEKGKTEAAVIVGWNRWEYFKKSVQTIAQNPESQTLPWFLFLDKYHDKLVTEKQASYAKSLFKNLTIIRRDVNYGCGRNIIDARRQVFDELGFDYAWIFEDDLVVAPNYMQFCRNLMRWGQARYDNVGAVQAWTKCKEPLAWKQKRLNVVRSTYDNWWAYMMSKPAWDSIKSFMYSYQTLFLGGEYHARPHATIVDWFHKYRSLPPELRGPRMFQDNASSARTRVKLFGSPPSGQDAATWIGFHQAGWQRLTPIVNRSMYIGVQGIHMTNSYWERMGFGEVSLDIFKGDDGITSFDPER